MRIPKSRLAGFVILIIGVVLTLLLVQSLFRDIPVWVFGRRTTATIEETSYEYLEKDDRNLIFHFKYRFTTPDGETVVSSSRATEEEYISYRPGSEITIKYFPLNPSNSRLDDSRFVPFLVFTYIPFILICWFTLAAGREMLDF
jgi:hypothetical protein